MQDALTIAIFVIPAAYALIMIFDFVSGLRRLIHPSPASIPSVDEWLTVIELPCPVEPEITLQPDPWLLGPEGTNSSVAQAPRMYRWSSLHLLSPAKPHIPVPTNVTNKQRKAELVATPKRRGRPRKVA